MLSALPLLNYAVHPLIDKIVSDPTDRQYYKEIFNWDI